MQMSLLNCIAFISIFKLFLHSSRMSKVLWRRNAILPALFLFGETQGWCLLWLWWDQMPTDIRSSHKKKQLCPPKQTESLLLSWWMWTSDRTQVLHWRLEPACACASNCMWLMPAFIYLSLFTRVCPDCICDTCLCFGPLWQCVCVCVSVSLTFLRGAFEGPTEAPLSTWHRKRRRLLSL